MNTEWLKLRILVAVQDLKSVFMCISAAYLSAPPHYVCSGDGTVGTFAGHVLIRVVNRAGLFG